MPSDLDPVLLLHGQPGGARDWDQVVGAIPGQVQTLAPRRPGWDGHSEAVSLAGNARAALAAMDKHRFDSATVVGHSFGGAVACWLAAEAPQRVNRLVLVAPSANLASLYRLDRWLATPGAGYAVSALTLALAGLALSARLTRRRIAAELALDEDYLAAAGRVLRAPGAWRAFVREQRTLVRELPELESRLGQITAPTTIVVGSHDLIVPPVSARRLTTQIPDAELIELERAGHLLPLRRPRQLAEMIVHAAR